MLKLTRISYVPLSSLRAVLYVSMYSVVIRTVNRDCTMIVANALEGKQEH